MNIFMLTRSGSDDDDEKELVGPTLSTKLQMRGAFFTETNLVQRVFVNNPRLGPEGSKTRGSAETPNLLAVAFLDLGLCSRFDDKVPIFSCQCTW